MLPFAGPWAGAAPPAVAYLYAPGRGAEHALRHLAGFSGVLQVDGYDAYKVLRVCLEDHRTLTLCYRR